MVNGFSSMSSYVTFSPHNFNWKLILNNAELYSLTILKSCNLRCIQSYRAFGRITFFWWLYIFFNSFHRMRESFTIRYSLFLNPHGDGIEGKSTLLCDSTGMLDFLL